MLDAILSFVDGVVQTITPILNNIVAAILIVFMGFMLGKFLSGILLKLLHDARVDQRSKKVLKRDLAVAVNASMVLKYGIYIIAFILALNLIGITRYVLAFSGIIFLVVIIFSVLISLKDFFPNLIAGFGIRKEKRFTKGKTISSHGVRGVITNQGLIRTRVKRENGDIFVFPNKLLREHS